jgi:alkylation response protein AidB-like acyl-CoA dehydrogenase
MNFGFNDEQELLRSTARKFFENECPSAKVRALMDGDEGVSPELWAALAEQGWLGLTCPEAYGGMELGLVDLTVLMEEMGRAVLPGPYLSTVVLGGGVLLESGSEAQKKAWLPRLASGEARVALAWMEPAAALGPEGVALEARQQGRRWALSGTKLFVQDAHVADAIVIAARTGTGAAGEGVTLFVVPRDAEGLAVKLLPTMDQTRKLCEVTLRGVGVDGDAVLGEVGRGWPTVARVLERATVALCAEMCGGAQKVLEMTVEYAKIRHAFGRPIGSYQGVKHRCADMLVDVENSKSLTYYAAWAMDEGAPDAALAVSMAKAYVSDAYRRVAGAAVQLHGGIGFTWEHDLHLYFKRAKGSEFAFGDATYHRERVAQLVNL